MYFCVGFDARCLCLFIVQDVGGGESSNVPCSFRVDLSIGLRFSFVVGVLQVFGSHVQIGPRPTSIKRNCVNRLSLRDVCRAFDYKLLKLVIPRGYHSGDGRRGNNRLRTFGACLPGRLPALCRFHLERGLFFRCGNVRGLSLARVLFPIFVQDFGVLPSFVLFFRDDISVGVSVWCFFFCFRGSILVTFVVVAHWRLVPLMGGFFLFLVSKRGIAWREGGSGVVFWDGARLFNDLESVGLSSLRNRSRGFDGFFVKLIIMATWGGGSNNDDEWAKGGAVSGVLRFANGRYVKFANVRYNGAVKRLPLEV